jgi:hypothetical protein
MQLAGADSSSVFFISSYMNSLSYHSMLSNPRSLHKTPCPEFASELYRPSDRRLSAKLMPNFADKRCRVVSETDPYGRIFGFLHRTQESI